MPYKAGKTWVTTVVGNKTVFHHEISVRLRRLRRIKSSYESHVIDVVDFNDGWDFRTTREIRHYVDFSIFVSGSFQNTIYTLVCEKDKNALLIQMF